MTRRVTLHLDEFGQQSLDRLTDGAERSPASAFKTAAMYYLADRDAGRAGWRAPRFRTGGATSPGLRIAFDDETWSALDAEATRQQVETADLAVHALLYFLADFDTGRVAKLLEDVLRQKE
jgi:hypothetical protein